MTNSMENVLVLDGNERSSLAIVRSLGRRGINVTVGECVHPTISSASKFCKKTIHYYNPYQDQEKFLDDIKEEITKHCYNAIFPTTDVTLFIILKSKEELSNFTSIPFVPYETYERASDKFRLLQYAKEIDIPIPKTIFLNSTRDFDTINMTISYPVVIKPAKSRLLVNGKTIPTSVFYAENDRELKTIINHNEIFNFSPFVIQEKINGEGIGFFALYQNGVPKMLFSHRRLREKPPSGGVSVLCESIPIDPKIKAFGLKLLNSLNWHGVAMVEFKRSIKDGIPYLMEINARFWGSLQLSIDAGIDFPYGLYCIAVGKDFESNEGVYKIGKKCKWILGNLDHFYMLLKKREFKNMVFSFLKDFSLTTGHFVWKMTDPKPFFIEIKQYLKNLISLKH